MSHCTFCLLLLLFCFLLLLLLLLLLGFSELLLLFCCCCFSILTAGYCCYRDLRILHLSSLPLLLIPWRQWYDYAVYELFSVIFYYDMLRMVINRLVLRGMRPYYIPCLVSPYDHAYGKPNRSLPSKATPFLKATCFLGKSLIAIGWLKEYSDFQQFNRAKSRDICIYIICQRLASRDVARWTFRSNLKIAGRAARWRSTYNDPFGLGFQGYQTSITNYSKNQSLFIQLESFKLKVNDLKKCHRRRYYYHVWDSRNMKVIKKLIICSFSD